MTKALDSTLLDVDAPVTTAKRWHEGIVNGNEAPTTGDKNLLIKIKIGFNPDTAEFACLATEHVGKHKPRGVTFCADHDCILYFSNPAVFGVTFVNLTKQQPETLKVSDIVTKEVTDCAICTDTDTAAANIAPMKPTPVLGPPHIVVP